MRLNKRFQYGLLFILYLYRAGRATVASAAEGLGVSRPALTQVAHKLKKAGIVKSFRGSSGGFEIVGEPTVGDVLWALGSIAVLSSSAHQKYRLGEFEERAFASLVDLMKTRLKEAYKQKIVTVGTDQVQNELGRMNSMYGKQEVSH